MTIALSIAGVALVLLALRDIFHQLFNPEAPSRFSLKINRFAWRAVRRVAGSRGNWLVIAGPMGLILVIFVWVLLLVVGWALVWWPHLAEDFRTASSLVGEANDGFIDALYLSITTLTTLGYGDISPTSAWLRVLVPAEAMIGFLLLTASITWVLSLYPILGRRNALAQVLLSVEPVVRYQAPNASVEQRLVIDEQMAASLLWQLAAVASDLSKFSVTYFFYERCPCRALPAALVKLHQWAEAHRHRDDPDSTISERAAAICLILDDIAATVASTRFPDRPGASTADILHAYEADHFCKTSD